MSIAIIRVPQSTSPGIHRETASGCVPTAIATIANDGIIPREVVCQLAEYASEAGKTIAMRNCRSQKELVECLGRASKDRYEFVILDPGICASNDDHLRIALSRLEVPYIEAHDDLCGTLEPALAPECGPRLHLIQGYGAQSYTLALSIALEYLGCAECENRFHVGT